MVSSRRKPRRSRGGSTKESTMHKRKTVTGSMNLGWLMRNNRDVDDALYPFVSNLDMVFDDMDFTVEEFSDISGGDLDELIESLNRVCKKLP